MSLPYANLVGQRQTENASIKAEHCGPRQNLADVLPLYGPYKLFLEPTRLCNFRCRFCPTGRDMSWRGTPGGAAFMDLALARRIEAQVRDSGWKIRRTHMYLLGEPLLHPQFVELCSIFAQPHMGRLDVRTNGALLANVCMEDLCRCGLDEVCVSVEGVGEDAYAERCGRRAYELVRANVARLRSVRDAQGSPMRIVVKWVNQGETQEELARATRDFAAADEHILDSIHNWSAAEAGQFSNRQEGVCGRIACPSPFYTLAVAWSGSALCCCVDYRHATAVGDLTTENIMDVWRGPRMDAFRRMHLLGLRKQSAACQHCDFVRRASDDLDADAERLLRCYQERRPA